MSWFSRSPAVVSAAADKDPATSASSHTPSLHSSAPSIFGGANVLGGGSCAPATGLSHDLATYASKKSGSKETNFGVLKLPEPNAAEELVRTTSHVLDANLLRIEERVLKIRAGRGNNPSARLLAEEASALLACKQEGLKEKGAEFGEFASLEAWDKKLSDENTLFLAVEQMAQQDTSSAVNKMNVGACCAARVSLHGFGGVAGASASEGGGLQNTAAEAYANLFSDGSETEEWELVAPKNSDAEEEMSTLTKNVASAPTTLPNKPVAAKTSSAVVDFSSHYTSTSASFYAPSSSSMSAPTSEGRTSLKVNQKNVAARVQQRPASSSTSRTTQQTGNVLKKKTLVVEKMHVLQGMETLGLDIRLVNMLQDLAEGENADLWMLCESQTEKAYWKWKLNVQVPDSYSKSGSCTSSATSSSRRGGGVGNSKTAGVAGSGPALLTNSTKDPLLGEIYNYNDAFPALPTCAAGSSSSKGGRDEGENPAARGQLGGGGAANNSRKLPARSAEGAGTTTYGTSFLSGSLFFGGSGGSTNANIKPQSLGNRMKGANSRDLELETQPPLLTQLVDAAVLQTRPFALCIRRQRTPTRAGQRVTFSLSPVTCVVPVGVAATDETVAKSSTAALPANASTGAGAARGGGAASGGTCAATTNSNKRPRVVPFSGTAPGPATSKSATVVNENGAALFPAPKTLPIPQRSAPAQVLEEINQKTANAFRGNTASIHAIIGRSSPNSTNNPSIGGCGTTTAGSINPFRPQARVGTSPASTASALQIVAAQNQITQENKAASGAAGANKNPLHDKRGESSATPAPAPAAGGAINATSAVGAAATAAVASAAIARSLQQLFGETATAPNVAASTSMASSSCAVSSSTTSAARPTPSASTAAAAAGAAASIFRNFNNNLKNTTTAAPAAAGPGAPGGNASGSEQQLATARNNPSTANGHGTKDLREVEDLLTAVAASLSTREQEARSQEQEEEDVAEAIRLSLMNNDSMV